MSDATKPLPGINPSDLPGGDGTADGTQPLMLGADAESTGTAAAAEPPQDQPPAETAVAAAPAASTNPPVSVPPEPAPAQGGSAPLAVQGEEEEVPLSAAPEGDGSIANSGVNWQQHQARNPIMGIGAPEGTPRLAGVSTSLTHDLADARPDLKEAVKKLLSDAALLERKGCYRFDSHLLVAGRASDALLREGKAGEYNVSVVTGPKVAGKFPTQATVIAVLITGRSPERTAQVFYGYDVPLPKPAGE